MPTALLDSIRELLRAGGAAFEEVGHEPVFTSEEAAKVRGCPLAMGAKSIVFKVDREFHLFVTSAARTLRSRSIRRRLGARRTRFASPAELLELTGLAPGAVPPFGEPVLPLPLHADPFLLAQERIAFTPGVHDRTIFVDPADYLRIARPDVFPFAE